MSNHTHVLVCLARYPRMRLRDLADAVGITERGVSRILKDLEEANVIRRIREGRRNRYEILRDHPLRHPLEEHQNVGSLLDALLRDGNGAAKDAVDVAESTRANANANAA